MNFPDDVSINHSNFNDEAESCTQCNGGNEDCEFCDGTGIERIEEYDED